MISTNSSISIDIRKRLGLISYSPSITNYPKGRTANLNPNFGEPINQQLTPPTVMPGGVGWEHPDAGVREHRENRPPQPGLKTKKRQKSRTRLAKATPTS